MHSFSTFPIFFTEVYIFIKRSLYFYKKENTIWTHFPSMIKIKIVEQLTISPLIRKYEKA